MHLYLAEKMSRLDVQPTYFFRLAHQWRFGRDVDVTQDALAYKICGIIPLYVQEYVHHIQKGESHVVQTVPRAN